jgi:KDO2-lipid IV(A) lauroyltransferase
MFDAARDRLIDLGYGAGWAVVKSAPLAVSSRVFRAGADGATMRNGDGVRQLRKNLRRVVGPSMPERQLDELVGAGMRSYARYWLETFRLPKMDRQRIHDRTAASTVGVEHLDRGFDNGRGVILALPHCGNWDAAAVWQIVRGGPFATVAERLSPESVYDRFVAFRQSLGMEIVALTGGPRPPMDVLAERLRANKLVVLLADRDLANSGIEVEFFGEAARMPPGPALLAATTGAALVPISSHFVGPDEWGLVVDPPIEIPDGRLRARVGAATQALADIFARNIAAHPADWHMLQPLWLADLPARHRIDQEP